MSTREVAVYGGSFDPPHLGHVLAVAWALATQALDELWIVPTWEHAFGKEHGAPFDDRLAMANAAFAPFRRVSCLDLERELGGVSRTLRTLEELRDRHPGIELRLLIGADVLQSTDRWHRWDDVVRVAPPIVVGREGYPLPPRCPMEIPNVSSTRIRDMLGRGEAPTGLIPTAVLEHIEAHGLYEQRT